MNQKSTTKPGQAEQLPPYIDDPTCREIYVDGAQLVLNSGVVRLELVVNRWDPDAPEKMNRRLPVARLVLAPQLAQALAQGMIVALQGGQGSLVLGSASSSTRQ